MPEYTQPLGKSIRRARLEQGLTQNQVANRIDVDVRTVLNIENYKGNPKQEVMYPLIRALHIDPSEIFYPELQQEGTFVHQLRLLLADCTEQEAEDLIPVCKAVLAALRKKNPDSI